ncbi:hypothetical protein DPMN_075165 [Dreissena polymorpha]|uniref:Uncharacterized protein n=1 Tax=Dreissena polymorpha TaxID=45954 RepID=A0A9D3YJZ7_DREPO|nr:hypothetical protein DPMN_075165 [Dreissena polymorpha]
MPRLPGGNVFQATETIFKLVQDMIGTYRLTKFHKDRKINVASRVLTRQHAPGPGGHVYIIGTKLLIKCHDDLTLCVASRVFTMQNARPSVAIFFNFKNNFKFVQNIKIFSPTFIKIGQYMWSLECKEGACRRKMRSQKLTINTLFSCVLKSKRDRS